MNRARILAAITGAFGLIGLGLTMLPLLTFKATDVQLQFMNPGYGLFTGYTGGRYTMAEYCDKYPDDCIVQGNATMDLGFLDLGPLSMPVVAIIPITLGLVGALGVLQAVRGMHRGAAPAAALLALGALLVGVFTWVSPSTTVTGFGEFATAKSSGFDTGVAVSPGIGLIGAVVALVVILAVGGYQSVLELLDRT